ncbi:LOW QUALITY PROTEIN: hypothetical protein U9M48_009681 [Paspalum notatum var. saurae]|uniref:Uncharacterized protein n=1 Tax=Paspalum notatum var. saurae TaxID=547442 RepID=A0AAQ3WFA4_PASNO
MAGVRERRAEGSRKRPKAAERNDEGGAAAGRSGALAPDAAGELDVLGHDGDALGVDGAEVGVLEEPHQASAASCSAATADDWNRRSVLKSCAISRTRRWKGSFRIRSSVLFWYLRISRSATVPGRKRCGFFTPPVAGADLRAAFVASCFRGALPPVDLRAVCFVRAIGSADARAAGGAGSRRSEEDLRRVGDAGSRNVFGGAGGRGETLWPLDGDGVAVERLAMAIRVLGDSARPLAEAASAGIAGPTPPRDFARG